uniref:Methyltransferase type 11 domain-containing protein n=1 Tax=Entomoneis paludosa TaxID=265537 RepID=A0A7S2Y564_9STRA|mmetsp:Transcript_16152/g.33415  ORF Transcript_16152/g.33415 Transcript_16152/m.33415 type:complete len:110 (+) Transcript_16152:312-641(+)
MVQVLQGDVTNLPSEWTESFDVILEKGLLDAVYLSGDGNVEAAVENLTRALRPGGLVISVSGVVPHELRQSLFPNVVEQDEEQKENPSWEWLLDGSNDLKAGCFVLKKL